MKRRNGIRLISVIVALVMMLSLLSGRGAKTAEKEDADTITVYLWTSAMYEKYAPYIQSETAENSV